MDKLNSYAMALLTATVAVSSILHVLGLDEKPWAKPILAVCFDLGGAIKGMFGARSGS
jgi:hypothetical protein